MRIFAAFPSDGGPVVTFYREADARQYCDEYTGMYYAEIELGDKTMADEPKKNDGRQYPNV